MRKCVKSMRKCDKVQKILPKEWEECKLLFYTQIKSYFCITKSDVVFVEVGKVLEEQAAVKY